MTVLDDDYPVALREIHQMPPLLFTRGHLRADEIGVSIVGTREPTSRGKSIAENVAKGLVQRGISVISGLAYGIDAAAHEATLDAHGRPIGVIGTGINRVYPAPHRELHERVAAAGALVSQFYPDANPTRQSFPMRNVTMSALGRASIIVEAGEHSGTRIQARVAVEHGRPVILTDLVAKATKWGKALQGRPGVYVASGTAEVMGIVEQINHRETFPRWQSRAPSVVSEAVRPRLTTEDELYREVAGELAGAAGGYLRNVIREPHVTCSVCGTPVQPEYSYCYPCNQHRSTAGIADLVAPLTYCIEGQQSYEVFRGYKDHSTEAVRQKHRWIIERLLFLGFVHHKRCIDRIIGAKVDRYFGIPSLSGRDGPHPFMQMTNELSLTHESPRLVAAPGATSARILSADQFALVHRISTCPESTS